MPSDQTILDAFGIDKGAGVPADEINRQVEDRLEQIHNAKYKMRAVDFGSGYNYPNVTGPDVPDHFSVEFEVDDVIGGKSPSIIGFEIIKDDREFPNNVRSIAYGFGPNSGFEQELEDAYGGLSGNIVWYDPYNNSKWDAVAGDI